MRSPPKNTRNVLLIDNNPDFSARMRRLLEAQEHTVTWAEDVLTSLDILVDLTPDIIFLKLMMPQINGTDLCRILRNMEHLHGCYIVLISAIAAEQECQYLEAGANACIAKGPFGEMSQHILWTLKDSLQPRLPSAVPEIKGAKNLHSHQVTKELLHQNRHLQVILEGLSQGIVEICRERIVYANPKAVEILGSGKAGILGARIDTLSGCLDENTLHHTSTHAPVTINGHQILLEQFSIANNTDSRIIILSDITERKKMEAVIAATNLTENLGYVFSGLRHEIGNPVNSIKMALSVLRRNLHEYDTATVDDFLDRSLQEVGRIEYLLKALKNYSLFEKPDLRDFSIALFFRDFLPLIKKDFASRNILLQTLFAEGSLPAYADNRALHHVMLNLLTNAADAVETCENPRITISARPMDTWIEIKVDDNGKGIPESDQQNLFKPFFTSKQHGTGLGLAIVKKMLSAMNCRIHIESYLNIGTTVTLGLPVAETTRTNDTTTPHH